MARKFFYVCAGLFLLGLGWHRGVLNAQAQSSVIRAAYASAVTCAVVDRTFYALNVETTIDRVVLDGIPGTSPVIACSYSGNLGSGVAYVVLDNGDAYYFSELQLQGWRFRGNVLATGPTSVAPDTWGGVKSRYR